MPKNPTRPSIGRRWAQNGWLAPKKRRRTTFTMARHEYGWAARQKPTGNRSPPRERGRPVEFVIQLGAQDVRFVFERRRRCRQRRRGRLSQRRAPEVHIQILDPERPLRGECVFDASA